MSKASTSICAAMFGGVVRALFSRLALVADAVTIGTRELASWQLHLMQSPWREHRFSLTSLCVTGVVLIFVATELAADEVTVVVPNGRETVDGNDTSGGFVDTVRYQQLIDASQFSSVPDEMTIITRIAMRPDASVASPITSTIEDFEIRLSTTTATDLSLTYADNVGNRETIVLFGTTELSTSGTPPGEVKNFDYVYRLQTPFEYDRSDGNLLVEFRVPEGFSSAPIFDNDSGPDILRVGTFGGDITVPIAQGKGNDLIPVLQVTFVAPTIEGDVNDDGMVDIIDFSIIRDHFNLSPTARSEGDLDFSGKVDLRDFSIWKHEFEADPETLAVPEPGTLSLLSAALIWTLLIVGRRFHIL